MSDGLVIVESARDFTQTLGTLEAALDRAGIEIFARVDHAANAAAADLALDPTTVLIFGSAKAGTPLMQQRQSLGLDLPLRMLVWSDGDGRTWVAYNDPAWLVGRHGLDPAAFAPVAGMTRLLQSLAADAAGQTPTG